jgi:hypothetical protein
VTSSLVSLHVTSHAECLAASLVGAFEGLFAGVTMAVNAQAAGPRKCFIACLADIAILRLREAGL